ncbi:MAG: flagellar biosynthetic protein FliR [Magnetococcales bacterium]|nr:flagellar biosynthetic protein FliR [Magnetococcales bacterium]
MDPAALMDFLGFSTGEVERAALVLARISGLFLSAPFFSRTVGPLTIRAALVMTLTLVLFPLVPHWPHEGEGNPFLLAFAAVSELLIGAIMGMLAHWVLVAVQVAGSIIGFEMGLSMAMVMDPTSGLQEGVISNMLYMAALMIFLGIDGHHILIDGLARSFHSFPPGHTLPSGQGLVQSAVSALGQLFQFSLLLSAPIVVSSKLLYLGMGLINRASPQIQVFFVSMPIAQLMGFFILGLSMMVFGQVLTEQIEAFTNLAFKVAGL